MQAMRPRYQAGRIDGGGEGGVSKSSRGVPHAVGPDIPRLEHMSDLPADLPCLHVLRTWHAMWLARIDKAIATAEQREAETRRGAEVRPPLAGARVRPLDTEQARQALVDVEACSMCRPDTDLGLL